MIEGCWGGKILWGSTRRFTHRWQGKIGERLETCVRHSKTSYNSFYAGARLVFVCLTFQSCAYYASWGLSVHVVRHVFFILSMYRVHVSGQPHFSFRAFWLTSISGRDAEVLLDDGLVIVLKLQC